jgi:hypothetical protein
MAAAAVGSGGGATPFLSRHALLPLAVPIGMIVLLAFCLAGASAADPLVAFYNTCGACL